MRISKIALSIIPFVMVSCLEVKTITRIDRDGSVERTVQLKGAPETIQETRYNIPREEKALWMITQDSVDKDNDRYEARARFGSVEELNRSFALNALDPGVQVQANLILDEGFFFDRYYYQEKIWSDLPGPDLPLDPYITKAELEALIRNETEADSSLLDETETDRLSKRLDEYLGEVIFDHFIRVFREGGRRSGHLEVIDNVIREHGDSLQAALNTTNYYEGNLVWEAIVSEYIDEHIITDVEAANQKGFAEFYTGWKFFNDVLVDDYQFSVELPGVIRNTTAVDVRGNLMSWEPSPVRLFFGGIVLEAESSVIKPWSLILTGLLLLATLVVTIIGLTRRSQV